MTTILYHDPQVTIYKELIAINKYYFPLATSRHIFMSEIERVTLFSSEGVTHRWGMCAKYMNNWFPYDSSRKNKKSFIQIVIKGKKMRPSITPDDPQKVIDIIWQNFTQEGKQYSERKSEPNGNETEIAQQQLLEREKQSMDISQQQLTQNKIIDDEIQK